MREVENNELREVVGGALSWSNCQYCDEEERESHDDEYDNDPLHASDYEPKPTPGIWSNYVRWFNTPA